MVTVNRAKDTRRHSTPRAVRTHMEYYLPSIIGERIPVCATVFSNVTSVLLKEEVDQDSVKNQRK